MVSSLIVVSINPPKTTRGLDALSLSYTSFLQKHIAFNIESDMICLMSRWTTWFQQKLISLEIHPNFICYLFLSLPGCLTFVKINKMLHFKGSLSLSHFFWSIILVKRKCRQIFECQASSTAIMNLKSEIEHLHSELDILNIFGLRLSLGLRNSTSMSSLQRLLVLLIYVVTQLPKSRTMV